MTGDQLADIRLTLTLTQQELADALGVHRVTVANWERGGDNPVPKAIALAMMALKNGLQA